MAAGHRPNMVHIPVSTGTAAVNNVASGSPDVMVEGWQNIAVD